MKNILAIGLVAAIAGYFVFTVAREDNLQNPVVEVSTEECSFQPVLATTTVLLSGEEVSAEIAQTLPDRARGLGGRPCLSKDSGMLFVFDTDGKHGFWMKDMQFPIDIIWIDAHQRVVHIESDVSPDTYPYSFTPPAPARYVLEVRAGFSDEHNLLVGDEVSFLL